MLRQHLEILTEKKIEGEIETEIGTETEIGIVGTITALEEMIEIENEIGTEIETGTGTETGIETGTEIGAEVVDGKLPGALAQENVDVAAAEIGRKEETVLLLPETPMHTYGDQGEGDHQISTCALRTAWSFLLLE